jgi:HK97 family phage portal protein
MEFVQGLRSYTLPTQTFLDWLVARRFRHGGNPVLKWMASNLMVQKDKNENSMPHKAKSTGRIDGLTAAIMALGAALAGESGEGSLDDFLAAPISSFRKPPLQGRALSDDAFQVRHPALVWPDRFCGAAPSFRFLRNAANKSRSTSTAPCSWPRCGLACGCCPRRSARCRSCSTGPATTGPGLLANDDPLFRLIHDSPNADYTAVEFWEGVVLCLALWGNAYAKKEFIGRRLVALTPLRCDLMDVRRNGAGQRVYRYSDPRGAAEYSEDEIFHVRGFGGAGDMGLSPISFARQSLGTAMAADEFAGAMFANGMRPNAILTVDQVLKETQRKQVQENIVAPYLGSENAGGVMVLEAGMKFQAVTMTPEDSQFLETRAFHVEELCRWFRVPPFMVGHTEKTTSWGSGLEQQLIGFLTFSLRPYLSRIEQAVSGR